MSSSPQVSGGKLDGTDLERLWVHVLGTSADQDGELLSPSCGWGRKRNVRDAPKQAVHDHTQRPPSSGPLLGKPHYERATPAVEEPITGSLTGKTVPSREQSSSLTANIYLRAQEVMTADNELLFADYEFVTRWNGTAAAIEQFADIRSEVQSESAGEAIGLVDQTRWDTQLHEAHVVGEHSLQLTQRCNASSGGQINDKSNALEEKREEEEREAEVPVPTANSGRHTIKCDEPSRNAPMLRLRWPFLGESYLLI